MITVEHLTKEYGNHRAVSDLSFAVEKGEILGLLGPNGAGKTTTMRILAGYLAPSSGRAEIAGYDILDDPLEARRHIGYLPETPPLYNDMTVDSYLRFVCRLKGIPASDAGRQIETVVDMTGLQPVYCRLTGNLSRGFRQRVGLAQALLGDPDVLILDEPTMGLDPNQIVEIRRLIKELAGSHTVILSSHILPEISMVCDRVVIVNHGRLIAMDTPFGLSHRMRGGTRLELRVRGPAAEAEELLKGTDGVTSVGIEQSEDELVHFVVEISGGDVCKERIFFAMSEARLPILEMKTVDATLEEVFMQLTTSEPEVATAEEVISSE